MVSKAYGKICRCRLAIPFIFTPYFSHSSSSLFIASRLYIFFFCGCCKRTDDGYDYVKDACWAASQIVRLATHTHTSIIPIINNKRIALSPFEEGTLASKWNNIYNWVFTINTATVIMCQSLQPPSNLSSSLNEKYRKKWFCSVRIHRRMRIKNQQQQKLSGNLSVVGWRGDNDYDDNAIVAGNNPYNSQEDSEAQASAFSAASNNKYKYKKKNRNWNRIWFTLIME